MASGVWISVSSVLRRGAQRVHHPHDSVDWPLAHIAAAADDDDLELVVQLRQSGIEMLAMGLDPTHDVRDATQPDRADSHMLIRSALHTN